MRIVAVGGPKGGKASSTTAIHLAASAAREDWDVLLVDCDKNRTVTDIAEKAGDRLPVALADGRDPAKLRRLRSGGGYDLAVVDLPGADGPELAAILKGEGEPVCDLLVAPTMPETVELLPLLRVLREQVIPLGLPHLMVFTRVETVAVPRAKADGEKLRAAGMTVANTVIRRYSAYNLAAGQGMTVFDLPGGDPYVKNAVLDYRALAGEVWTAVGMR